MSVRNFDSDFCGSLPLHQINQIQPYGYLLVLSKPDLKIIQASTNISEVFGIPATGLTGHLIEDYTRPHELDDLRHKFSVNITDKIPVSLTIRNGEQEAEYIAVVHSRNNYLIAELEPAGEKRSFIDIYQQLKFFIAQVNLASTVAEVSQVAVDALKKIGGWDRVLMYQFDDLWNGSVIAEVKEEEMESYMGLKFPASDIPKQARALYLTNSYRLIANRDAPAVPLYPVINPASQSFIDLSGANLRSVAGVHLEYMANMGIKASMSVRVIRNGTLWGLVSCHHREPKPLAYEICSVFELLSEVISSRISNLLNREEFEFRASLLELHADILERVYASEDFVAALFEHNENLLQLFDAGGAALSYKGRTRLLGNTPERTEVEDLVYWLQGRKTGSVFSTNNLSSDYEQATNFVANGSGLLAMPVGKSDKDFILLFRPESQTTVNWGGNPEEAIRFEGDGKKYHPRNSFQKWKETVKQTSRPWLPEELEIAENFRSFIFEYTAKHVNN